MSAPEARRILPERSPVTRADCERAGGAARPFRKEFWSRRPSQYGTGTEALRGDTHCVHTVSAPEARRILAERSPVTHADCERAGGAARPFRKEFWSWRPSQYGTGTEALRGDTHCVHTVSVPEARRILAERPPVTRADCERAGGVAHSLARVSPVSCTGYRLLQRSILHRNPFLVLRPAGPPEGQARRTFLL